MDNEQWGSQRGFAKTGETGCGLAALRMTVAEPRAVIVGMEGIERTQELATQGPMVRTWRWAGWE